ncbi:hypothetical protein MGAST_03725 [Mycobacterium gastri 'Wayne']|uniref:Uncharacterized protein n=1 Tax=Mycobacterium gastri TaxID=1777 RepID=A0A1X1VWD4_MYCGS|nr:hypothetical protein MGAST_03725 [Mycobacterium gastri 'Wayne']ORV73363.1 hypothetical protein AWC07_02355 [Mycobacterium gastri]
MDLDDGPTHGPSINFDTTARYDAAVECSSATNLSQATAAVTNGPDPGPAYIRPELTSGGNTEKSNARAPSHLTRHQTKHSRPQHCSDVNLVLGFERRCWRTNGGPHDGRLAEPGLPGTTPLDPWQDRRPCV